MAEVATLGVTGAHTARGPSASAYKLLYTYTQQGTLTVHICNTTALLAKIRVAVVEPGYAYADGDVPALYQFWYYDEEVQAKPGGMDTIAITAQLGTTIVVWTDTAGVTFCPHGFLT
jgi:hypothetical protein